MFNFSRLHDPGALMAGVYMCGGYSGPRSALFTFLKVSLVKIEDKLQGAPSRASHKVPIPALRL